MLLSIAKAAAYLGRAAVTLRRWEKKGALVPMRTLGNQRRYTLPQLDGIMKNSPICFHDSSQGITIKQDTSDESPAQAHSTVNSEPVAIYCRVSQPIQKQNGDLGRQADLLTRKAHEHNYSVRGVYQDVGSGLNDKRRGLIKMFSDAAKGKFRRVLVTYPDRLSRFCVAYLERHLMAFGVAVDYVESKESITPQEELVQDLTAVITCFSGKLHGMRAKKNFEQEMERVKGLVPEFKIWIAGKNLTSVGKTDVQLFLAEKGIKLMKRGVIRLLKAVTSLIIPSSF